MVKSLVTWLTVATPAQRARLAKLAGTSVNYLYQLASGHRSARANLARDLELASKRVTATDPSLPILLRTDLCDACSRCEFAKAAQ